MENHQVVCSACSDHYIALGSSTFVLESEDKKKSKKEGSSDDDDEEEENENDAEIDSSQMPHVISVFDLRKCTDPVLTIKVGGILDACSSSLVFCFLSPA
ncbi:hypothetical protein OESDEN_04136 [Oesophagostomum dentatum]|uniref:Uncharacterized protein n=1 Tax=Oesophagostomum dentatum TaxID=61180 RepID=A0A0B1TII1_OESDE|nr:hypothetical protein OESDEN_04136 [Oesophagostomum dentatum]